MKIRVLGLSGFCFGAAQAFNNFKKIIAQHEHSNIYLIGQLLHNQKLTQDIILHHPLVHIYDDTDLSRYDLVDQIGYQKGDVIVFSAHGTRQDAIDLAKQKGFITYDLICDYVKKNHQSIQQKLTQGYYIGFFGNIGHPETKAIISLDQQKIIVFNQKQPFDFSSYEKVAFFCQTTLNYRDFSNYLDANKNLFPHEFYIQPEICAYCRMRQELIDQQNYQPKDAIVIISDKKSNNGNVLFNKAKEKCCRSFFVQPGERIPFDPHQFQTIYLLSATSVSHEQVDQCLQEIKSWQSSVNK